MFMCRIDGSRAACGPRIRLMCPSALGIKKKNNLILFTSISRYSSQPGMDSGGQVIPYATVHVEASAVVSIVNFIHKQGQTHN